MVSFGKVLAFGILLGFIIVFSIHHQHAPIKSDFSLSGFLGLFCGLTLIVLLVERATELVVFVFRQPRAGKLKQALARIEQQDPDKDQYFKMVDELSEYRAQTKTFALGIGFALGLVICGAGVGMLESILSTIHAEQSLLRGVDIVLTAGLIAGGSDSLHQLVRAFETFFGESIKLMKKS
jgi:hypothetical protein